MGVSEGIMIISTIENGTQCLVPFVPSEENRKIPSSVAVVLDPQLPLPPAQGPGGIDK